MFGLFLKNYIKSKIWQRSLGLYHIFSIINGFQLAYVNFRFKTEISVPLKT